MQELHRLMSHSVTVCDQMEKQILGKVHRNYERWLVKTVDSLKGSWSKKPGKEQFYSNLLSLSANPVSFGNENLSDPFFFTSTP